MRLLLTLSFVTACFFNAIQATPKTFDTYLQSITPLDSRELTQLVSGNSIIGKTHHTDSMYELYFDPSGKLYFRKNHSEKETYIGKWWVKDGNIYSQWPTYNNGATNQIKYYPIIDNAFLYKTINSDGSETTYEKPFLLFPGNIFNITDS
ncbi:MAG: hypothetical protein P4L16_00555 [Chlamydiales bacterium]|nr:hypothetical protein [Chlamydiales bacterium]